MCNISMESESFVAYRHLNRSHLQMSAAEAFKKNEGHRILTLKYCPSNDFSSLAESNTSSRCALFGLKPFQIACINFRFSGLQVSS